jgi:hypothetical protein
MLLIFDFRWQIVISIASTSTIIIDDYNDNVNLCIQTDIIHITSPDIRYILNMIIK